MPMPPSTAHTPSGADLGGPVIVPIMLVPIQLYNNVFKITADPLGMCPMTLPLVFNFTVMAASLRGLWASL